jgi:hypothetical protein
MKQKHHDDAKFEQYRKERKLRRTAEGCGQWCAEAGGGVGRLLDAAEAKEAHEQRLTREVHEFFANATRTAALIMERFCERATTENIGRISDDMQEFLQQAIMRAQSFMQKLAAEGPTREAERHMLAKMHNLVGPLLDEFRIAGTASVKDRHIGMDPFTVPAETAQPAVPCEDPSGIEEHLVAEVVGKPPAAPEARPAAPEARPAAAEARPAAAEARPAAGEPPPAAQHPLLAGIGNDPQRLKKALRLLVEGGIMAKSEAKRIWEKSR